MSDTRKPMTQEELAEIRELAEAATPGPWYGCFEPKENMIEAGAQSGSWGFPPLAAHSLNLSLRLAAKMSYRPLNARNKS